MKLDLLAFGAHPDDVELGAGGTLAKHSSMGQKVGIVDLTLGEMGTRGTPEIRLEEATNAAEILGCVIRKNLKLRDGFILNDEASQMAVIEILRKYKPEIVLINAPRDRHPDHGAASELLVDACFKSGFKKLKTQFEGKEQESWRPKAVYHYIQYYDLTPDFVVDISGFYRIKQESILAHKSQFYNPESNEPETVIASKSFIESIEGRAREFGRGIYTDYGEGFIKQRVLGVDSLDKLI